MATLTIYLFPSELDALVRIATDECRPLTDQLIYLLKQEAKRRGLIAPNTNSEAQPAPSSEAEAAPPTVN